MYLCQLDPLQCVAMWERTSFVATAQWSLSSVKCQVDVNVHQTYDPLGDHVQPLHHWWSDYLGRPLSFKMPSNGINCCGRPSACFSWKYFPYQFFIYLIFFICFYYCCSFYYLTLLCHLFSVTFKIALLVYCCEPTVWGLSGQTEG